jgi:hypothetical protein
MTRHGQVTPTTEPRRRRSTRRRARFAVAPAVRQAKSVGITTAGSPTKPKRYFLDTPAARHVSVRDRRWHTRQHKSP